VDHLILALLDDSNVKEAMKINGINRGQIETTVAEMRGGRKVTGENAEETYSQNKHKDLFFFFFLLFLLCFLAMMLC
jgi:hypothetical protein